MTVLCRNVKTLQEWVTDCLNTARKDLRSALEWLNRLDTRLEACRLTVRKTLQYGSARFTALLQTPPFAKWRRFAVCQSVPVSHIQGCSSRPASSLSGIHSSMALSPELQRVACPKC